MKTLLVCSLAMVSSLLADRASAEGRTELSAELSAVSDYVTRGFSRTGSGPALQAGFRLLHRSGFVAGSWASTVSFDYDDPFAEDVRRVELQAFAGYTTTLGQGWSGGALLVRYQYPDVDPVVDKSYTEGGIHLYYRELLSFTVSYTPDFLGSDQSGLFAEISARYPLPRGIDFSTGLGFAEVELTDQTSYAYGHVAVNRSMGRFDVDLGYYLSGARDFPRWGEVADGNWALVFSVRVP